MRRMQDYAEALLAARSEITRCKKQLQLLCAQHEVVSAQAAVVGVVTACVLWVHLGDPRDYDSGPAYRKAMGLNLKEYSSGKWLGQLRISKRGPSEVRRHLYFTALRMIRQKDVRAWYESQKSRRGDQRGAVMRALVGVMRKLPLALYQVGVHGKPFDPALLFPGVQPAAV